MVINKINFPIYSIFILLSILIGCIYIYFYLKNRKIKKRDILLFIFLIAFFALIGGILISFVINKDKSLSSYAGAIAVIIAGLFYEKINPHKKDYITSSILSLPLIYSIGKIGCFFAGCCNGLPYNGIISVTYTNGLNVPQIPIQLIESVIFMTLFILLNIMNKNKTKDITLLCIMSCAFVKFLLDFLRYEHINISITKNQIISLIFIIIVMIYMIYERLKKKS